MQTEMERKSGTSRRIKILLGVSLALNLAVVGLVAGTLLRHGEGGRGGLRMAGLGAYGLPYMMALPHHERRAVIHSAREGSPEGFPDRAARRALYAEVLSALRNVPYDPEKLSKAVERQAATTIAVQEAALGAWMEVVGGMTDAERENYAQDVEEVLRRGPRRRK
ncbi:periplasmic heavy metal sensor [uncultured Roseobacter sp.]|uniref:periplasmic heavy metal sensor n=1 Tax=uncultured Roseobacter sp. TaxID=114847 RepID=UPI002634B745|nr:periplasmic heavy metal sensor [uncultured Roseobacter sp.]